MPSTYGPQVTFDLPSGEDAAQRIADTVGLEDGEYETWAQGGEAPDDVRSALYDALRHEYDHGIDAWSLLPRRVEWDGARVTVTLAPVSTLYDDEGDGPEVDPGPRQRVLRTLKEYHEQLGANEVATSDLLAETVGDVDTLREELERLETRGEVYQPSDGYWRVTGAE